MTRTVSGEPGSLRLRTAGQVIGPDDVDYDDARRVWNGEIDRRPAVIVRCADAADVSTAIGFARENGLEITVRGGAHNAAGTAVADGSLMIDLSRLDTVQVDPPARRARVGGGATLAQLDAAAQEHGLATPAGTVSHTGVGGLTLGGGMGWLTRKFGLALDNVTAVEIVTADGAIRRAAADENPDLFWAVRGGGRQLRCGHRVRVPVARGRPHGGDGAVLLEPRPRHRGAARGPGRVRRSAPRSESGRRRDQRPAGPVRTGAAPAHPRAGDGAGRLRCRRAARRGRRTHPDGAATGVRDGHPDAVRRAPADVRRGQRLGVRLL